MSIPLGSAYLCSDCNCVGANSVRCDCGSASIQAVRPMIDRIIPNRALVIDSRDGMRFGGKVTVDWVVRQ
jgi:hypothetical protein